MIGQLLTYAFIISIRSISLSISFSLLPRNNIEVRKPLSLLTYRERNGKKSLLNSSSHQSNSFYSSDKTRNFQNNNIPNNPKSRRQLFKALATIPLSTILPQSTNAIQATDEITLKIPKSYLKQGLGVELSEVTFRDTKRVIVKSIQPNSISDDIGIQPNYVFVSINNQSLERTDAKGVSIYFKRAMEDDNDSVSLTFRDPEAFRDQLSNLQEGQSAATQIAPSKVKKEEVVMEDQKVSVTQIKAPTRGICSHPADENDLLEISYVGTVVETGKLFDSTNMKINGKEIPGRGGDITIYFVLGKQPMGQFPPGKSFYSY